MKGLVFIVRESYRFPRRPAALRGEFLRARVWLWEDGSRKTAQRDEPSGRQANGQSGRQAFSTFTAHTLYSGVLQRLSKAAFVSQLELPS